jgi:hypothetical protein
MATSPETVRSTLELPRALALNVLELRCPGVHELTRLSRPESRDARIDLQRELGQALYVTGEFAYASGEVAAPDASTASLSCDVDRGLHLFDLRERLAWHARGRGFDVWFGRGGELHVARLPGGSIVDGISVERRLRLRVVEDAQQRTVLVARHGTRWTADLTDETVAARAVGETVNRRGVGLPRAGKIVRGDGDQLIIDAESDEVAVPVADYVLAVNAAYVRRHHGAEALQRVQAAAGSLTATRQRNRYAVKDRFVAMGESLAALGWMFDVGGGRSAEIVPTLAEIRVQESS